jgi:dolichol kinase
MQIRKLVHLSGAVFPVIAWFSPYLAVVGIAAGIVAFFALEAFKYGAGAPWMSLLYRDGERAGIANEPLLYLVSIASLLLISLFFLPSACYAAIVVLAVGDGIAGVVGKAFGKHKVPYGKKTWEGTAAYARRFENISVAASSFIVMAILTLFF